MRVFVDEGVPMARLLRELLIGRRLEKLVGSGIVPRAFLSRLAASFDRAGASILARTRRGAVAMAGLVEPLSAREQEVLALLAKGQPTGESPTSW